VKIYFSFADDLLQADDVVVLYLADEYIFHEAQAVGDDCI
jgi:hypothetical protein